MRAAAGALVACVVAGGCAGPLSVRDDVVDAQALGRLQCVGVLPFDNATKSKDAGLVVAQAVASALLTSGHVNVLPPDEATHLLDLMMVPGPAGASADAGLLYGRALGVDAVLVGTVTEFQTPAAGGIKQPVIGFVAQVVETATGRVLWSAATSNYHHAVLFDVAEPRAELLRAAAESTVDSWVDLRSDTAPSLGPCGELQAKLSRGEIQPAAAATAPGAPAVGSTPAPGGPSAAPAQVTSGGATTAATTAPAPGASGTAAAAGSNTPAPTLPGLPDLPGAGGAETTQAPSSGLPALPGDLPPLPGELPALPPEGGGETTALASLSPAPSPGSAPAALIAKLTPVARDAARRLYGNRPVELAGAFPNYTRRNLSLSPKARRLFDGVVAVMRSSPGLAVRVTVRAPRGVLDIARRSLAPEQAQLVRQYFTGAGIGADRVDVATAEQAPRRKRPSKQDNVLSVAVLRY